MKIDPVLHNIPVTALIDARRALTRAGQSADTTPDHALRYRLWSDRVDREIIRRSASV